MDKSKVPRFFGPPCKNSLLCCLPNRPYQLVLPIHMSVPPVPAPNLETNECKKTNNGANISLDRNDLFQFKKIRLGHCSPDSFSKMMFHKVM